ncbi:unnamed protein product [Orchesella dallaii]|uniref:Exonuclease domain-containing protein n=1 Tax=Orchesella dallaii TaxID=48710 RepID=A0ABP1Q2X5_9HEXA
MHMVRSQLVDAFTGSLVVVAGGTQDFLCVDLVQSDFFTFDIQQFYRRHHDNQIETYGMSLRDVYFMEFGEDFQGNQVHSAEKDATATIKIFVKAYVRRNLNSATRNDPHHFEIFDNAVKF